MEWGRPNGRKAPCEQALYKGGKQIWYNGRIIQEIADGKDVVTTSHKVGHSAGLFHPNQKLMFARGFPDLFYSDLKAIPFRQSITDKKGLKQNLMTSYTLQSNLWGEVNFRAIPRSVTKIQLRAMQYLLDCVFCMDNEGNGEDINRDNIEK